MANNRVLFVVSTVIICIFVLMAIGSVFRGSAPDEATPDEPEEDEREDESEDESEDEQFYRPFDDILSLKPCHQ